MHLNSQWSCWSHAAKISPEGRRGFALFFTAKFSPRNSPLPRFSPLLYQTNFRSINLLTYLVRSMCSSPKLHKALQRNPQNSDFNTQCAFQFFFTPKILTSMNAKVYLHYIWDPYISNATHLLLISHPRETRLHGRLPPVTNTQSSFVYYSERQPWQWGNPCTARALTQTALAQESCKLPSLHITHIMHNWKSHEQRIGRHPQQHTTVFLFHCQLSTH